MRIRETDQIELKETYVEDIRKEVIAFANTLGGVIYIGIDDDGNPVGVDDPDVIAEKLFNSCRDSIRPDITMFLSVETVRIESSTVLKVTVEQGSSCPYYIGSKGLKPSGVYVRQGKSSVPASEEAIRRMIMNTAGNRYESMRSMSQDLTFNSTAELFGKCGLEFGEVQKRSLGLVGEDGLYTNLALLLSDQCPHRIKAAVFSDDSPDVFQDRREFSGSLLAQAADVYEWLMLHNARNSRTEGMMRVDRMDYSETALREMLFNALVHREYGTRADTLISVYGNRIETMNFGGLSAGISLEEVLQGFSVCRNQRLANVFYRLRLIEAYGTGLRKILGSCKGLNCRPEFIAGQSTFKVILPNRNTHQAPCLSAPEESNSQTQKVLRMLSDGPHSRKEIQDMLATNASATVRLLRELKDAGRIEVLGNSRNIRYRLRR